MGGVLSWLLAEALGKVLLVGRVPRMLALRSWKDLTALVPWPSFGRAGGASLAAASALLVWKRLVSLSWEQLPRTFGWRLLPIAAVAAIFGLVYLVALQISGVRLVEVVKSLRRPRLAPEA